MRKRWGRAAASISAWSFRPAKLAEACRDDDGSPGAAPAKLANELRHALRRGCNDGEVRRFRQACHIPEHGLAENLAALRIDRPDRPRQARAEEICEQHIADRPRPRTRPDQRNGTGCVHAVEISDRHGGMASRLVTHCQA
jgi:hypothetical protein